jgi:hypothetical protein
MLGSMLSNTQSAPGFHGSYNAGRRCSFTGTAVGLLSMAPLPISVMYIWLHCTIKFNSSEDHAVYRLTVALFPGFTFIPISGISAIQRKPLGTLPSAFSTVADQCGDGSSSPL